MTIQSRKKKLNNYPEQINSLKVWLNNNGRAWAHLSGIIQQNRIFMLQRCLSIKGSFPVLPAIFVSSKYVNITLPLELRFKKYQSNFALNYWIKYLTLTKTSDKI